MRFAEGRLACAPLLAMSVLAGAASAGEPNDFAARVSLRGTLGLGHVPLVNGVYSTLGMDWSLRPFRGAFLAGTGASVSWDLDRRWSGGSWGIFLALDVTYVVLSSLWSSEPSPTFPVRLIFGGRVGLGATQSRLARPELEKPPAYWLVRPELHLWSDLEWVFLPESRLSVFARGAIDTPVSLNTVFRVAFALGFAWGYQQ